MSALVQHCRTCSKQLFPPRLLCPACGGDALHLARHRGLRLKREEMLDHRVADHQVERPLGERQPARIRQKRRTPELREKVEIEQHRFALDARQDDVEDVRQPQRGIVGAVAAIGMAAGTGYYVVGVGAAVNRAFIESLARAGRGASEIVSPKEGLEPVQKRLARKVIFDDGALLPSDLPAVMQAKYVLLNRGGVLAFEYGGVGPVFAWRSDEDFRHQGRFWRFPEVTVLPRPVTRPPTQLRVGSSSPLIGARVSMMPKRNSTTMAPM